jgi:hypothetical protein
MTHPIPPDALGTRLLVGCVVVLVLVIAGATVDETWQRRADEELQRVRPNAGRTAIVLDGTDPMSAGQVAQLQEYLRRLEAEEFQPGDLVTVWSLGSSAEGPLHRELLLHCPPWQANPIYQNPVRVAARYDSLFAWPLRQAVEALSAGAPARWSPIMEALRAVSEAPEFRDDIGRHCLILVSDLQQHTPRISLCTRPPSFNVFRQTRLASSLRPDLRGIAVLVFFVPRARHDLESELALEHFWRAFLKDAGAQSVQFERL